MYDLFFATELFLSRIKYGGWAKQDGFTCVQAHLDISHRTPKNEYIEFCRLQAHRLHFFTASR